MPELPEVYRYAEQLNKEISGKTITGCAVFQEKCFNINPDTFIDMVKGQTIDSVTSKGKWIFINLRNNDALLVNMGMGGELLYLDNIPHEKYQAHFEFDKMFLSFRFWWFGYIHYKKYGETHTMTDTIGKDYIRDDVKVEDFLKLLSNRRGAIKAFLLNQKYFSGIGNYYIHDILYQAKLHPNRAITSLTDKEKQNLYNVIIRELNDSISKNAFYYEKDIYGNNGGFLADKIAYKDGESCKCGDVIVKIKTGSTSSYICPTCQKEIN